MDNRITLAYALEKAKLLIKAVEGEHIKLSAAYLFGSCVNGTSSAELSDIDVALISENFSGFRFNDNLKIIPIVTRIEPRIETHPFRVEDFNDSPFAQQEIVAKGIRLELN